MPTPVKTKPNQTSPSVTDDNNFEEEIDTGLPSWYLASVLEDESDNEQKQNSTSTDAKFSSPVKSSYFSSTEYNSPEKKDPAKLSTQNDWGTPPSKKPIKDEDRIVITTEKLTLAKNARGKFQKRSWQNLFAGNICIGEDHGDITPKKFLIENMALLKASGFNCIFMEHLSRREHQFLLDEFLQSKFMDPELNDYLDRLNEGHMEQFNSEKNLQAKTYNFKTVVEEAVKNGIRIIALEDSLSQYHNPKFHKGKNRMLMLNDLFLNKIEVLKNEFRDSEPKWLAFIGSGHVNTHKDIPGVADIVDCQDLIIRDINDDQTEYLLSTDQKEFFKLNVGTNLQKSDKEKGYLASMVLSKKWHDSSIKFEDNLALPARENVDTASNIVSLTNNPENLDFGSAEDLPSQNFSEDKEEPSPKTSVLKRDDEIDSNSDPIANKKFRSK